MLTPREVTGPLDGEVMTPKQAHTNAATKDSAKNKVSATVTANSTANFKARVKEKVQCFAEQRYQQLAPKLYPKLPALVRGLEHKVPVSLRRHICQLILRQLFGARAKQSELDFLQGKSVRIEVTDFAMGYRIALNTERQLQVDTDTSADVLFKGDSAAFLALMTQQADPDTLFFRRKLLVIGDTETGLHLKNYLDQIALEPLLPKPLQLLALRLQQDMARFC